MNWILLVGYILVCLLLIYSWSFFKLPAVPFSWLSLAFLLKVCVGIGLIVFLKQYYPRSKKVDVFNFYKDGNIVHNAIKERPKNLWVLLAQKQATDSVFKAKYYNQLDYWFKPKKEYLISSNQSIILLHSILAFLPGKSIYLHSIWINFLSFIGIISFIKVCYATAGKTTAIFAFLTTSLLPSFLIFSSALLKESLAVFFIGLTLWYSFRFLQNVRKWPLLLAALLSLFFLAYTKFYLSVCLCIPLIIYSLQQCFSKHTKWRVYALGISLIFTIILLLGYLVPNYSVFSIVQSKQHAFMTLLKSRVVNYTVPLPIVNSPLDIFTTGLVGLRNVFLPPAIFSFNVVPIWIDYLLLLIGGGWLVTKINLHSKYLSFGLMFIGFSLGVCLLIGTTTPILYAIYRYRSPVLPILLVGLFTISKYCPSKSL